jgi:hypothetical protein
MTQKKSPRETIENEVDASNEHLYMKFPCKELIAIPSPLERKGRRIRPNLNLMNHYIDIYNERCATVHTHPYTEDTNVVVMPSCADLKGFIRPYGIKTMVIAQHHVETGKMEGYLVIRKTKKTRPYPDAKDDAEAGFFGKIANRLRKIELEARIQAYNLGVRFFISQNRWKLFQPLDKIAETYDLRYRFFPVEGYEFNKCDAMFIKKQPLPSPQPLKSSRY